MDGKGTFTVPGQWKYEGDWVTGDMTGYGIRYYNDGSRFEGHWLVDKKHGKGKRIFKDGTVVIGVWSQDFQI